MAALTGAKPWHQFTGLQTLRQAAKLRSDSSASGVSSDSLTSFPASSCFKRRRAPEWLILDENNTIPNPWRRPEADSSKEKEEEGQRGSSEIVSPHSPGSNCDFGAQGDNSLSLSNDNCKEQERRQGKSRSRSTSPAAVGDSAGRSGKRLKSFSDMAKSVPWLVPDGIPTRIPSQSPSVARDHTSNQLCSSKGLDDMASYYWGAACEPHQMTPTVRAACDTLKKEHLLSQFPVRCNSIDSCRSEVLTTAPGVSTGHRINSFEASSPSQAGGAFDPNWPNVEMPSAASIWAAQLAMRQSKRPSRGPPGSAASLERSLSGLSSCYAGSGAAALETPPLVPGVLLSLQAGNDLETTSDVRQLLSSTQPSGWAVNACPQVDELSALTGGCSSSFHVSALSPTAGHGKVSTPGGIVHVGDEEPAVCNSPGGSQGPRTDAWDITWAVLPYLKGGDCLTANSLQGHPTAGTGVTPMELQHNICAERDVAAEAKHEVGSRTAMDADEATCGVQPEAGLEKTAAGADSAAAAAAQSMKRLRSFDDLMAVWDSFDGCLDIDLLEGGATDLDSDLLGASATKRSRISPAGEPLATAAAGVCQLQQPALSSHPPSICKPAPSAPAAPAPGCSLLSQVHNYLHQEEAAAPFGLPASPALAPPAPPAPASQLHMQLQLLHHQQQQQHHHQQQHQQQQRALPLDVQLELLKREWQGESVHKCLDLASFARSFSSSGAGARAMR
eukprot:jgi/Mesen1/2808/ME000172S01953